MTAAGGPPSKYLCNSSRSACSSTDETQSEGMSIEKVLLLVLVTYPKGTGVTVGAACGVFVYAGIGVGLGSGAGVD